MSSLTLPLDGIEYIDLILGYIVKNTWLLIFNTLYTMEPIRTRSEVSVDMFEILHQMVNSFLVSDGLTMDQAVVYSSTSMSSFQHLQNSHEYE